jgi:hypothetical protein
MKGSPREHFSGASLHLLLRYTFNANVALDVMLAQLIQDMEVVGGNAQLPLVHTTGIFLLHRKDVQGELSLLMLQRYAHLAHGIIKQLRVGGGQNKSEVLHICHSTIHVLETQDTVPSNCKANVILQTGYGG